MSVPQQETCIHGHDLTDAKNVVIRRRGKYKERQCLECNRRRAREWWRKNRGKR
jgi:hypothetical protein